jgi:hypothetical protein
MFGQDKSKAETKTITKQNDISNVLGTPIYESTIDSLNTKVWIVTQQKYKEMMKTKTGEAMGEKKDTSMKMDKETKNEMVNGTHYFIFDVTNITNRKEVADTSAKVEIVSPSKKNSSVNLQPMMNHFGGGVLLDEKGEYLFTINLDIGTGYKTTQFMYKIK